MIFFSRGQRGLLGYNALFYISKKVKIFLNVFLRVNSGRRSRPPDQVITIIGRHSNHMIGSLSHWLLIANSYQELSVTLSTWAFKNAFRIGSGES